MNWLVSGVSSDSFAHSYLASIHATSLLFSGSSWSRGAPPTGPVSMRANGLASWPALRAVGAGFWLTDSTAIRTAAEQVAKGQFAARNDPCDCALMYMALGSRSLLQSLFRSAGHTRQADFLKRDFRDEKNMQAARKNAFVLLGQHRHDMAAAFFLLGAANDRRKTW